MRACFLIVVLLLLAGCVTGPDGKVYFPWEEVGGLAQAGGAIAQASGIPWLVIGGGVLSTIGSIIVAIGKRKDSPRLIGTGVVLASGGGVIGGTGLVNGG